MSKSEAQLGRLITLEGGEGAGKSSLLNFLFSQLQARGVPVVKTREPGGSRLGDVIRKLLLQTGPEMHVCARAELMLFLAARAQHVEEFILPALQTGKVVLCDRFHDSTIAYQGFARGFGAALVEEFCRFAASGIVPNLTLFLDIDPLLGMKRKSHLFTDSKGRADRIEAEEMAFHEEVRQGFLLLAERNPDRIRTLDASAEFSLVCQKALQEIDALNV